MMKKLKNIIGSIMGFFSKILPKKDKADHFIVFLFLARTLQVFQFEDGVVIAICSIPILGKELVIDKWLGMGEFETLDIVWGYAAVFLMVLYNQAETHWLI